MPSVIWSKVTAALLAILPWRLVVVAHQRTGIDRRAAAVSIRARKGQGSGAALGQAAGAADDAGQGGAVAVGVDGAAARIQRDGPAAGKAAGILERAAAEGEAARGTPRLLSAPTDRVPLLIVVPPV